MPPPRRLAIACSFLLLAACSRQETAPPPLRPVLVQPAAAAGATPTVYTGEVRARHEAELAFRVGGKIAARLVDAGAEVKPGMPLARLDPADLQLSLQAAHAQVTAAESEFATAKAERERYADLVAKRFVSQAAFDAKDNLFKSSQARLEQVRAQAAVSGNQAGYGTLTADQAGVVTAILADVGQVVSAGQAVMRFARPEEKEVSIAVPEGRLAELKAANDLWVFFWAQPGLQVKGELRELSPAADPATRTYAARIRLITPPSAVTLGMTAQVAIGGPTGEAGLVVPLPAVVDLGQGPAVWVVKDNKAQRRPVQVSRFREDGALIAGGLEVGELVVVAGALKLVPDQPVTPQPVTPANQQR